MIKYYIASLIVLLTIMGCPDDRQRRVHQEATMATTSFIDTGTRGGIIRYIDKEAGVVCYVSSRGMFCIPIQHTNLKERK